MLRILRSDDDTLLTEEERSAKLRESCVADQSLAGIEFDDGVCRENVTDVAYRERNRQLGLIKLCAAVRVGEIGVAANVLFIQPTGSDFKTQRSKLRRIGASFAQSTRRARLGRYVSSTDNTVFPALLEFGKCFCDIVNEFHCVQQVQIDPTAYDGE